MTPVPLFHVQIMCLSVKSRDVQARTNYQQTEVFLELDLESSAAPQLSYRLVKHPTTDHITNETLLRATFAVGYLTDPHKSHVLCCTGHI